MIDRLNCLQNDTHIRSIYASCLGATMENALRQPLTAISIVMINQNKGLYESIESLSKRGGVGRFYNGYQGFAISWIMRSSHRCSTFATNHKLNQKGYSNGSIAVATTVAEFATTALGELVLTVAQAPNQNVSPIVLIKRQYQREGFKALTTGFLGNSIRNGIFNGVLFGLKNNYEREIQNYPVTLSGLITLSAVILSHPAEVIRARKVAVSSSSYPEIVWNIYKESAFRGFMSGLGPRIASAGVGTFVAMATYSYFTKN